MTSLVSIGKKTKQNPTSYRMRPAKTAELEMIQ